MCNLSKTLVDKGIGQGRFEEKIERVKNGLINNIPLDAIMVMSKLSKEEIENIRLQIQ